MNQKKEEQDLAAQERVLLVESQYLGSINYFARLVHHPKVWIERCEHFIKSTYRNRCYIATPQGRQRLTVPLQKGKGQRRSITNIQISYHENWRKLHWDSMCYAYRSSPYFEYYEDHFYPFYHDPKKTHLLDLNQELTLLILELINAKVDISFTDHFAKSYPENEVLDFRSVIHPKVGLENNDAAFKHPQYHQVFEEKTGFIPYLSIVDLLFAKGPQSLEVLKEAL